jgi:hypothetical protein
MEKIVDNRNNNALVVFDLKKLGANIFLSICLDYIIYHI